jgi:hypothetical protein
MSTKKKVEEGDGGTPFTTCVTNALQFIDTWSKATYKIDREVYGGDEEFCSLLEKTIWVRSSFLSCLWILTLSLSFSLFQHEADRFRYFVNQIQTETTQTTEWLQTQETLLFEQCSHLIEERQYLELSVTERLIEMIRECIMQNIPIYHQWQVTYDGISVRHDRRIYPYPDPDPIPSENIFQPTHLNDEQLMIFDEMLRNISLNNTILKEDLVQLMLLCQSGVGPYGQIYHHSPLPPSSTSPPDTSLPPLHIFDSVAFPKLWRTQFEDLLNYFNREMNCRVEGTHEIRGVIAHDTVMEWSQRYGAEKYQLLANWTGGI